MKQSNTLLVEEKKPNPMSAPFWLSEAERLGQEAREAIEKAITGEFTSTYAAFHFSTVAAHYAGLILDWGIGASSTVVKEEVH